MAKDTTPLPMYSTFETTKAKENSETKSYRKYYLLITVKIRSYECVYTKILDKTV